MAGADNCPRFSDFRSEYLSSSSYKDLQVKSQDFYRSLQPALLNGVFPEPIVTYGNAYLIYDYLNYGSIHNISFSNDLSREDLTRAKSLADSFVWAMFGNTSAPNTSGDDHLRGVAGRTLAYSIVQALGANIESSGLFNKMTLLFGGFEPIVSFASLAGLASEQNPQFFGIPDYGSSMVFELYSLSENDSTAYPSISDLNIRFFFQNGTSDSSELVAYPLFGNGPSGISMKLNEFTAAMRKFMIRGGGDWCKTCASFSIFCPAFAAGGSDQGAGTGNNRSRKGLSPVVAGVVGAIVTLLFWGWSLLRRCFSVGYDSIDRGRREDQSSTGSKEVRNWPVIRI